MKTMADYTIYCTEEQTNKALELGASLKFTEEGRETPEHCVYIPQKWGYYTIPTAEQMICWLEEQEGIKDIVIARPFHWVFMISDDICYHSTGEGFKTRKEVTLAAIDAALESLIKNMK